MYKTGEAGMATMGTLHCSDSVEVVYRIWKPTDGAVKAVLLILHGMAEHSARYDEFATLLTKKHIAVYAPDHRGHGQTALKSNATMGWFAETGGWQRVVDDALELANLIATEHPEVPLFIMGHSMGSFLTRTLIAQNPDLVDGAIIMGSGASQGLLGKIGKKIASRNVKKYGSTHPDKQMDKLSFGSFNKKIAGAKTPFDWLSRDEAKVKEYIDDPLCGFLCTSRFFCDLIDGVEMANDRHLASRLPADLPMLIISGTDDPVGKYGKGVKRVHELYQGSAIEDLSLSLIEGGRHELLNETDRETTMEYLTTWITTRI